MQHEMVQETAQIYEPDTHKYISFVLGRNEFCVDILTVREIGGWSEPTTLPHAPFYVCGVINLRGTVLPIIDFAERLGISREGGEVARPVTIIMHVDGRLFGIKVDSVSDILVLDKAKMQKVPDGSGDEANSFLESIMAMDSRMIRVVDPSSLFPATELSLAG